MTHNLVIALREVKPRRLFFTTYTFHPAFFEAAVLPVVFRPEGSQVQVLVDAGRRPPPGGLNPGLVRAAHRQSTGRGARSRARRSWHLPSQDGL